MITRNKRFIGILLTAALLLFIPLIAMQFTDEVNWTLADFLVATGLLFGTGFACELVMRNINSVKYRITMCAAFIILLVLIWAELAVGLFGSPFAGS